MSPKNRKQIRWYAPQQEAPISKKELEKLDEYGQGALLAAIQRFSHGESGVSLRQIDSEIYEIRVAVGNNQYRALLFKDSPVHYIIVHVFVKKTQKLPKKNLERARKRMTRWKSNNPLAS